MTYQKAKGTLDTTLTTILTVTSAKRTVYFSGWFCNQGAAASRLVNFEVDGVYMLFGDATNNAIKTGETQFFSGHIHVVSGALFKAKQTVGTDVHYYISAYEAPN